MRLSTPNLLMFFGLIAGVLCAAFAARELLLSGPPAAMQIETLRLEIGEIPINQPKNLAIHVTNPNYSSTGWIVGSSGSNCGIDGCFLGLEPASSELRPQSTITFFAKYKSPPVPGPFEKEFIIYSTTNTLSEHKLKVTGVAIATKKNDHYGDSKNTKGNPEEKSDAPEPKS